MLQSWRDGRVKLTPVRTLCGVRQDLLHSGVPPVVMEGQLWRNRIAPAMLRRVGLDELVAQSTAEFVSIAASLVLDAEYRELVRTKVLHVSGAAAWLACVWAGPRGHRSLCPAVAVATTPPGGLGRAAQQL